MLRYRLGKDQTGDNLLINGDFSNGLTNWNNYGNGFPGWAAVPGGVASVAPNQLNGIEYQNALRRGQWYRMKFKVLVPFQELSVVPVAAREYKNYPIGQYSYDFQATNPPGTAGFLHLGALGFLSFINDGTIAEVELYSLVWNPPTTDVNDLDFSYEIERDSQLEGVITEFSGDIEFSKEGYNYLSSINGFCAEVPILVEKKKNGVWLPYIEGIIFLSDVEFDEKRCTAKATIEHAYNQTFINAKDTQVNLELGNQLQYALQLPNSIMDTVAMHDINGNYVYTHKNVFNFNQSLRLTAIYSTNSLIDVNAIPFTDTAEFGGLGFTTGAELSDTDTGLGSNVLVTGDGFYSFKDLFGELNKIFALGWIMEKDADGVGTVRVDYKENFFSDTIILELEHFVNTKRKFFSDAFYRNVKIGYRLGIATNQGLKTDAVDYDSEIKCSGKSLDLVAGFIQSTPLIRRKLSPITNGTNTATAFNALVVAGQTFSTTITTGDIVRNLTASLAAKVTYVVSDSRLHLSDDIFTTVGDTFEIVSGVDSLDGEMFIFEIHPDTKKTKIYPNNTFNGSIDPADNAARWIKFLPSSLRTNTGVYSEIIKTNEPIVYLYEGETQLNDNQFDAIKNNPLGKVGFDVKGVHRYGWIKALSRNERSGICSMSLITTEAITP